MAAEETKTKLSERNLVDRIITKRRDILIKFRSMQDIMNEYPAWFDQYGNIHVADQLRGDRHLAPSFFQFLGKTVKMKSHHGFPDFCIDKGWDELFAPNMALRAIASGKYSKEDMMEMARQAGWDKPEDQ